MNIPEPIDIRSDDKPTTRLTRLAEVMLEALHAHPEFDDDIGAIVLLDDDADGGIALDGYDENEEAIVAMLTHLKALAEASGHGANMEVITIPNPPEGP